MLKAWLSAIVLFFLSIFVISPAKACNDREYKDDFGICWPKGDNFNPPTPQEIVTSAAQLVQAVASGNADRIAESIGAAIIASPTCVVCEYAAVKLLPNIPKENLNRVIGRGILVFLATGEPVLVVVDVLTGIATEIVIATPSSQVTPAPKAPSRGHLTYSATAVCLVQSSTTIYAFFKADPVFKSEESGEMKTFPKIDLAVGDVLKLTGGNDCADWNDPARSAEAVTNATLYYKTSTPIPGEDANRIAWSITGPLVK